MEKSPIWICMESDHWSGYQKSATNLELLSIADELSLAVKNGWFGLRFSPHWSLRLSRYTTNLRENPETWTQKKQKAPAEIFLDGRNGVGANWVTCIAVLTPTLCMRLFSRDMQARTTPCVRVKMTTHRRVLQVLLHHSYSPYDPVLIWTSKIGLCILRNKEPIYTRRFKCPMHKTQRSIKFSTYCTSCSWP